MSDLVRHIQPARQARKTGSYTTLGGGIEPVKMSPASAVRITKSGLWHRCSAVIDVATEAHGDRRVTDVVSRSHLPQKTLVIFVRIRIHGGAPSVKLRK